MNRRWHVRRALATRVAIELDDGAETRLHGNTGNLGLGGMSLRLPVRILYPNAQVLVHFPGGSSSDTAGPRLSATVVWTSGLSAGLMFDDFDVRSLRAIWKEFLRHGLTRKDELPVTSIDGSTRPPTMIPIESSSSPPR